MRKQATVATILMLLSGPAVLSAGSTEAPQAILEAPGRAEYPEDDGLILWQTTRIHLATDGKVTRHEESAVKVLGPYIHRLGILDPGIHWNDRRSTLTVHGARTYRADGTVLEAKPNSFVPNTSGALQWAVPYAHMRQMTVAHVGVETGSTSVLAYTVEDREPSGVPLWGMIELQGSLPVLDREIVFEIPAGTPFHHGGLDCAPEPQITREAAFTRYTFRMTDLPPVNTAERSDGRRGTCRLLYSTAEGWGEVRRYLNGHIMEAMVAPPVVTDKVAEIVGETTVVAEKAARIHEFVREGVRTVHWPIAAFDYIPRPADVVLESSVGHPLDQAVLLATMLQEAGLTHHFALVATERGDLGEVPSPAPFDQIWVEVFSPQGSMWLDPTGDYDHMNVHQMVGRMVFPLSGRIGSPQVFTAARPGIHHAALRVELSLEDEDHDLGLSGTADLDLGGYYHPAMAYDRTRDRTAGVVSALVKTFGGSRKEKVFIGRLDQTMLSLRATFEDGVLEIPSGAPVRLTLPRVPGAVTGEDLDTSRAARTLPLSLPAPATEKVVLVLTLPEGFEPAYLPPGAALDNSVGSFQRTVEREGHQVTVRVEFTLKEARVDPPAYPHLRALMAAREGEANETILLKRAE